MFVIIEHLTTQLPMRRVSNALYDMGSIELSVVTDNSLSNSDNCVFIQFVVFLRLKATGSGPLFTKW